MKYDDLISSIEYFGVVKENICENILGVKSTQINENVIIAPSWEIASLMNLDSTEMISNEKTLFSSYKVWNMKKDGNVFTYIKTGFSSPVLMDAILALGNTNCKKIVFVGSAGALDAKMHIGDIVIPAYSVCGDGASRYISPNGFVSDVFGQKTFPNSFLLEKLKEITNKISINYNVNWHIGFNFSIDTIFAQYFYLNEIVNLGCNVIEMETAAAFKAAELLKIPLVAIFCVSDNTVKNKSLIGGRDVEMKEYRKLVKNEVIPEIIMELFKC